MNLFVAQIAGLVLRGRHAGEATLACNDALLAGLPRTLSLSSETFDHESAMPLRCAGVGVGSNLSPALAWSDLPDGATHWVLIVEDPDAPLRHAHVHALAVGSARVHRLEEGALNDAALPDGVTLGRNASGAAGYAGPRPLPGHGPHRYVFQLFATRAAPPLAATRHELARDLRTNAISRGRLDGFFARDWLGRPITPALATH